MRPEMCLAEWADQVQMNVPVFQLDEFEFLASQHDKAAAIPIGATDTVNLGAHFGRSTAELLE